MPLAGSGTEPPLLVHEAIVRSLRLNANPPERFVGNIWRLPIDERKLTPCLFATGLQVRDDPAEEKRQVHAVAAISQSMKVDPNVKTIFCPQ
jgi:hypothetical protein